MLLQEMEVGTHQVQKDCGRCCELRKFACYFLLVIYFLMCWDSLNLHAIKDLHAISNDIYLIPLGIITIFL
eukprot:c19792_g1_i2 orf=76-288(+)